MNSRLNFCIILRLTWLRIQNRLFVVKSGCTFNSDPLGGVMVCLLGSSEPVGRGFEPRPDQTKDYKSGICCISAKYAALRSKNED